MRTHDNYRQRVRRQIGRPLLAVLALAFGACAENGPTTGPEASPVEFTLRGNDGGSAPVVVSATAGGRTIEIVSGSLRFESFASARGQVVEHRVIRVVDPGDPPVETVIESESLFERRADTVRVVRRNGTSETYQLEDGGRRLRTIAASGCSGPPGIVCTDQLQVFVFERMP